MHDPPASARERKCFVEEIQTWTRTLSLSLQSSLARQGDTGLVGLHLKGCVFSMQIRNTTCKLCDATFAQVSLFRLFVIRERKFVKSF